MRKKVKPFTPEDLALITELHEQGVGWHHIGERLGHSRGACQIAWERQQDRQTRGDIRRHYWTDAEDAKLRLLRAQGKKFKEIDLALGLALGSSSARWSNITGGQVRRAAHLTDLECPRDMHRPKDIPAHHSPVAALLGDPPRGRSAFDRRQAGIIDPPAPVGQGNHGPTKKPTLPSMPWREDASQPQ